MVAYNRCLQVTFIIVQLLFLALGAVMIGVGSWLEIQERSILDAIENETFLVGPYLIIAAGCAVVLVAIIGMCGAFCDWKCNRFLLVFYIILVLIVFVAQLVGGILGFVFREELNGIVTDGLMSTQDHYGVNTDANTLNNSITESWDFIQETFECCGLRSSDDWFNSTGEFDPGLDFPSTCCNPPCDNSSSSATVFETGCIDAVTIFLQDQLLIVAAIGIAFVVGEIVVVLMAFCLICCTDFDE